METRRDLTPWMTDVFVAPEFRRRGIASALVRRVMEEAKAIGVPQLFLFTTGPWRERLYAGLGWSVIDRPIYLEIERVLYDYTSLNAAFFCDASSSKLSVGTGSNVFKDFVRER